MKKEAAASFFVTKDQLQRAISNAMIYEEEGIEHVMKSQQNPWNLSADLKKAALQLQITVRCVSPTERGDYFVALLQKFFHTTNYQYPLWELPSACSSVRNQSGWKLVEEFIGSSAVFLAFENTENQDLFEFRTGKDLVSILNGMHGFVFYLFNPALDYLLCFNDHDYLIGWGSSRDWITSLPTKT